jgi:hypothetical protein
MVLLEWASLWRPMIVLYEHTRVNGPLAQGLGPKINELVHLWSSHSFVVMLVLVPGNSGD